MYSARPDPTAGLHVNGEEGRVPTPAKILVVDDQPLVRYTLRRFLAQQSHWEIYEAANGKAALDRVSEIDPDVVVLDIVMPGMNGLAAAKEIHRVSRRTKIVLISSHYTTQEAAKVAFFNGNFVPKSEIGTKLIPTINCLLPEERHQN
jgi:DNA-binding NarL/FixJ family response regulator